MKEYIIHNFYTIGKRTCLFKKNFEFHQSSSSLLELDLSLFYKKQGLTQVLKSIQ